MLRAGRNLTADWSGAIARAFWCALLLVHIPALAGTLTQCFELNWSGESVARLVAVLLCIAFFIIKVVRPGFLSLPTRRSSLVVFLLVCALVHPAEPGEPGHWQWPAAIATTAIAVDECRRRSPAVRKLLDDLRASLGTRLPTGRALCAAPVPCSPSGIRKVARRASGPRAPPA